MTSSVSFVCFCLVGVRRHILGTSSFGFVVVASHSLFTSNTSKQNCTCTCSIIEMTNDINMTLTTLEMELEASNTALREALSFKNSHIAMLEERLLKMSFELASSRAREDEQKLLLRQSTQGHCSTTMSMTEDDDFMLPADIVDDSDSIKSVLSQPSSSSKRPSLPGRSRRISEEDNISNSLRSLALSFTSTAAGGGIIGNMTKLDRSRSDRSIKFDRSDRSDNLRVDFPTGGRRTTMMDEYSAAAMNSAAPHQRKTVIEQLFRSRKRLHMVDADEQEEASPHRTSSPKLLHDHQDCSRLIGSTVLFPTEDDNYSLGFE